ncbi:MAG TPA: DUF1697 domain-containing protein [Chloroflexota bacterium]
MTTRLVALLRGVNVGPGNRIAMAALRGLLSDLGYTDVATLLNSGNAVFTVAQAPDLVAMDIEAALMRTLGVKSAVVVRTAEELSAVVACAPLLDVMTDPAKFLVGFLSGDPIPAGATAVAALDVAPDQVRLTGRELYLWCPAGVLASPLSQVPWDKSLGVDVTMRNWNTVTRLLTLVQ